MEVDIEDKVVVITGANHGIGLGLAKELHRIGSRVAGLDLTTDYLDGIRNYVCDVTDPAQTKMAVELILAEWGRIDVLVNNACLAVFASFEEKGLEMTRQEFEVNYYGYIHMINAVLPVMKAQGQGVIHNVSSTVGTTGFAGIYGYASTKGAVEALTRTLALELKPYGIVVNIIHPPLTRTASASPLGVPDSFMADPDEVGRKLAPKIGSHQAVITPGFAERAGVFMSRILPNSMGRFLSEKSAEARSAKTEGS